MTACGGKGKGRGTMCRLGAATTEDGVWKGIRLGHEGAVHVVTVILNLQIRVPPDKLI
jgi:hypothetical protein